MTKLLDFENNNKGNNSKDIGDEVKQTKFKLSIAQPKQHFFMPDIDFE